VIGVLITSCLWSSASWLGALERFQLLSIGRGDCGNNTGVAVVIVLTYGVGDSNSALAMFPLVGSFTEGAPLMCIPIGGSRLAQWGLWLCEGSHASRPGTTVLTVSSRALSVMSFTELSQHLTIFQIITVRVEGTRDVWWMWGFP